MKIIGLLFLLVSVAQADYRMEDRDQYCHFVQDEAGDEMGTSCDASVVVADGVAWGYAVKYQYWSSGYFAERWVVEVGADILCVLVGPGGTEYTTNDYTFIQYPYTEEGESRMYFLLYCYGATAD